MRLTSGGYIRHTIKWRLSSGRRTFSAGEAEKLANTVNVLDMAVGIRSPPLVLGARIVEILGGNDERSNEYAVAGTWHPCP